VTRLRRTISALVAVACIAPVLAACGVPEDSEPKALAPENVPFYGSWLNRIEAQFTALRYFALDGTDHPTHHEQSRMIRRYIAWRNRNAHDKALCALVKRANVA